MSNPNWGEVATTTLAHRRKRIADAVSKNNILLYELRRRKAIKTIGGGRTITTPILMGDENANFQWYTGREALNVAGQEVLTSAEFPWKQWAVGVSISGLEMLQNSGPEQIHNMMASRIKHAEKTIQNQMHKSAYGDGTGSSGKEFGGLGLLVNETAGATVGGINSTTYGWWDNMRSITGVAVSTTNIYANMLNLFLSLRRGTDMPDLIVSDNTYYSAYNQSLQSQQRFMDKKLASGGFSNIMFETAPVVADGGNGGYADAGMKFLNMDSIELIMHKKRNNVVLGGPRRPLTEDSDTVIMAGMGNFVINNRMLNGVLAF
ncbi:MULTISPECIES: phage major capsid protein [Halocynthiibacter]|uniref:Phage major capsid protein n=1 Tax=Halocynthiibacter halioticoli TaxID=2986804 RepID=A0AAE3J3L0_9RHOB|nr:MULTISPECIES: phage major capsid protein [Halocynthiibacter]MCV6826006.1 phage major capsid protein [Halocynthiibacter halioticoli]MCW4059007.1 phage major capsid protein [Halocynthiibacter sp. SDUM655004]